MATVKTSHSVTTEATHFSEQVGSVELAESGLSVDPEDVGRQFLAAAVEQSTSSEWPRELHDDDFASDDALALSEAFDLDMDMGSLRSWERALLRALANGQAQHATNGGSPLKVKRTSDGALRTFVTGQGKSHAWDEVDLTGEVIHEASLLDHEGPELGEAIAPSVLKTDDTNTHGKPRGGHLPTARIRRRASPRAHSGKTLR